MVAPLRFQSTPAIPSIASVVIVPTVMQCLGAAAEKKGARKSARRIACGFAETRDVHNSAVASRWRRWRMIARCPCIPLSSSPFSFHLRRLLTEKGNKTTPNHKRLGIAALADGLRSGDPFAGSCGGATAELTDI